MPVILMTAQATLQSAMQAVNEGAFYYIQKPFRNDELLAILRRAAEHRTLRVENRSLRQEITRRERTASGRPAGTSKCWLDVVRLAEAVAPTESTILIQGESGTGKEIIARYIHQLSQRTDGQFLSINCGALPESLLESELFGHVKGSFTGAVKDKSGLFTAAAGGTFFLDEIGETTPATQVKLLRVLQHREVIPVGATEAQPIDVRLLAATNRDLEEEIKRGELPQRPVLPAQRHRDCICRRSGNAATTSRSSSTFPACASAQARNEPLKHVSADALEVLKSYAWPGNVRGAGERAGAGGDPHDRGRHRRARCCPSASRSGARSRSSRSGRAPIRRSTRSSARTSCGCCRARAATRRGPPKCSASIPRRSIASCRGSGSRRDRLSFRSPPAAWQSSPHPHDRPAPREGTAQRRRPQPPPESFVAAGSGGRGDDRAAHAGADAAPARATPALRPHSRVQRAKDHRAHPRSGPRRAGEQGSDLCR